MWRSLHQLSWGPGQLGPMIWLRDNYSAKLVWDTARRYGFVEFDHEHQALEFVLKYG